jgi:hypothetical protein
MAHLEKRIRRIENYSCGNINRPSYINEVKQLKQELAELLTEEAKRDKLRSLPLYSCRITGWKFVCSECYDKVYTYAIAKEALALVSSADIIGKALMASKVSIGNHKGCI